MTTEANAFLMGGGGGRSATFENVDDRVWGVIMAADVRQQTKFQTNEPMVWNDGRPRMQLVVTLLTELRDDDEDDGLRKLYVRGQMQQAVQKAVIKAGAPGIAEGGRLLVQFVGVDEPKQKGMNGAKRYFAKYEPPVVSVAAGDDDEPDALPF